MTEAVDQAHDDSNRDEGNPLPRSGSYEVDVSTIIVSWNTRELVLDCIDSIEKETSSTHEVIVIDNASSDGTAQAVRDRFPSVTVIANEHNAGFAAANNQGIVKASGRLILLLNPDTVILDKAIDRCIERIDQDSTIGVLGCQVWETPEVIQKTGFRFPGILTTLDDLFAVGRMLHPLFGIDTTRYDGWDRRSDRDLEVVSGMFMLIPRTVLDRIGTLDERYFIYAEEADFCWRVMKIGLRRTFWCGARILHIDGGSKSTAQIRPQMFVQMIKSKLQFIRKNRGVSKHVVCWFLQILGISTRLLVGSVLLLVRNREMDKKRLHVWFTAFKWLGFGIKPVS